MFSLKSIRDKISTEDKIRTNSIRNHPKYYPGFDKEVRTETFWNEPEFRNMLVERRTGQN